MIRVCVMGTIGSGKSFISKLFNCPVFNADKEVNNIYRNHKDCFTKLKKKIPNFVKSFPIRKSELKNAISADIKNLKLISSIVHPIVRSNLIKFLQKKKNSKMIILDIPLLIENKLYVKGDVLIFIKASKSKVIDRIKKRRNYDKKIINKLNSNQTTLSKKMKLANYIVDNNFSPNIMKKKIKKLRKRILDERSGT